MKDEFNHVEIDGKEADAIQVKMDDVVADAEKFAAEERSADPDRNRKGGAESEPVMEEQMSDEEFNEELKELMEEDNSGKKKKKKKKKGERGRRKKMERQEENPCRCRSRSGSHFWCFQSDGRRQGAPDDGRHISAEQGRSGGDAFGQRPCGGN